MASKVWLITGANSGLGLALAHHVLSRGDKVIAAARDISKLPASLSAAQPLALNPSAPEAEVYAAAREALKIHGRIDVLANNAGYCLSGPVEELDSADIHAQFQTNVFGPIALIQALLPSFRGQKSGHILNFSSIAAMAGGPSFGAYNASKAALEAFSEALNPELAPYNVRVHIVVPGFFPTNFLATAAATLPKEGRTTGAYADPAQGAGAQARYYPRMLEAGIVGDPDRLAERVWEVVWGAGPAGAAAGKREFVRVPLGRDCGNRLRAKLALVSENVEAFEPAWSATDVSPERLQELRDQAAKQ
ncbi:NAD-P-binding protein [Artomyces pyxidatus]|uniref:NAD-P-binding protein n=1 Tax=Artomyces pyxidatus TaxID=48021 RepID=A0ACB8TDH4_9AGAM|nr:NAD-P-binding protein [Artomyces pyxidatus]